MRVLWIGCLLFNIAYAGVAVNTVLSITHFTRKLLWPMGDPDELNDTARTACRSGLCVVCNSLLTTAHF